MAKTVLIRGAGRQAAGLLSYFSELGYVCTVVSSNAEALTRMQSAYRCQVYRNSYDCLQHNNYFDVAVIASKPSDHLVDLENILKFSAKSIIIEKPLAHNIDDARKMQLMLLDYNGNIYVNYPFRKQKIYAYLHSVINNGANGKLLEVDATICFPRQIDSKNYPGCWWVDKSLSGGGVIYQVGIHWINFIFSLLNYDVRLLKASMLFDEQGVDDAVWGLWESTNGETMVNVNLNSAAKYYNSMIKLRFENAVYIYDNDYVYVNCLALESAKRGRSIMGILSHKSNNKIINLPITNLGANYLNNILSDNMCDKNIINDAVNDILIYNDIVNYQAAKY